jgi:hypothetical protein
MDWDGLFPDKKRQRYGNDVDKRTTTSLPGFTCRKCSNQGGVLDNQNEINTEKNNQDILDSGV